MTGSNGGSLISDEKLKQLYAAMLHRRLLADPARKQRRGARIFKDAMGQEALITGWTIDLRPEDTLVPNVKTTAQFSALIAAAANHKRKKKVGVVVVFASMATTQLADWHKAMKQAAKRRLPIIFVVENNPWGVRLKALPDDDTVLLTARAYGLPAIPVDGNDVVAVYRVACESLERVRDGAGPVLIEGKTYHAVGQRGSRADRDPLFHMERYLTAKNLFTLKWKRELQKT